MPEEIKINGKITYVLYRNPDNYYIVAKFRLNDVSEKMITVTGYMPEYKEHVLYNLYGSYVEHPRYGIQFKIISYEIPLPNEEEALIRYFSGVQFSGIGKKTAARIVEALGEDCIRMIREDPSCLQTVPGLTDKQIQTIRTGVQNEENGLEELVRFLNINGIGMRNLIRLNHAYGKEAMEKLKENPYRVIEECDGFGFLTADKIGKSLGIEDDDPRRLYAALITCAMDACVRTGNSYLTYDELAKTYAKNVPDTSLFDDFLHQAYMNRQLVGEEDRIYPVTQYDAERDICRYFAGFPYEMIDDYDEELLENHIFAMQNENGIEYDEKQLNAIRTLFREPVSIITGGPGTGKTTVIRAMTEIFQSLYPSLTIVCAAPTGRAAKRLSELTGAQASTIHSLLQWNLETNTFGRDEADPITADLLIIDEFSMVDVWLFANLLKASRNVKKICIVGDEDQLPSVGPGSVLRDMIASEQFPLIRLDRIFRQKEGNTIIQLAHDINHGITEHIGNSKDTGLIRCRTQDIREAVIRVVSGALEKGYSMDDIQVLSPMYGGAAGIDALNKSLQDYFNPADPDKREVRVDYTVFREGDKILQKKNQPDDDVFNGDIGVIAEIIDASESVDRKTVIVADFQGNFVEYTNENWENITLAYCISVHKAQGSEYPIVIMPFSSYMYIMLQRKLIYTAVSRARKSLILIGDINAMINGVKVTERSPRMTTLAERLKTYMNGLSDDAYAADF